MSKHPRHGLRLCLMAVIGLGLAGCDTIGDPFEGLGPKRTGPDEFQVLARAPLVMPTADGLPEPRPGAASPLDPTPKRDARAALLGPSAAVAEPQPGLAPSAGENALLRAAEARDADPAIRTALAEDRANDRVGPDGKYEAPSLFDLVIGGEDEEIGIPRAEVLDPRQESRRLQKSGLAAPNDPNALPPGVQPEGSSLLRIGGGSGGTELEYVGDGSGPVRKRLEVPGTGPAFPPDSDPQAVPAN